MTERWRPICDKQHLWLRAQMLAKIREFFTLRQVLEVETPLLCHTTGTDPQLDFFAAAYHGLAQPTQLFLQTSPEFAMKRLLAAGSGSIYQICKAFRNGESGRWHNPEFTMLEWYRTDFSLLQLMAEVVDLLQALLTPLHGALPVRQVDYQTFFDEITGLDPLTYQPAAYRQFVDSAGFPEAAALCGDQQVLWLDFIFSHCVQPAMTAETIYLLHGYPAVQSSLARINPLDARMTERFEVFINGVELGNGYFELSDPKEQEARFDREIAYRHQHGLNPVAKDELLLAALRAGLPDCSGVALGLDRLLMIISDSRDIAEVLAFPLANA